MDTKKKILLVEDDTALAAVYRARLELEGLDVREVNTAKKLYPLRLIISLI